MTAFKKIPYEDTKDHKLYLEAMVQIAVAKKTKKENDFKLALRITEEIEDDWRRVESLRTIASALIEAEEIDWALLLTERMDPYRRAQITAKIAKKETGSIEEAMKKMNN